MRVKMHGVVSILDEEHYARVEGLWDGIEATCGLKAVKMTPIPHFSWHIAEDYDFEGLEKRLEEIAEETAPFVVRTTGMGVFNREALVVYIPIYRDPNLCLLHQRLWEQTSQFGKEPSPLYAPDTWLPHITLANRDVNRENLACVMRLLVGHVLTWEIRIDNFAVVCQEPEQAGKLKCKFQFSG
jgi:2'-5' RNA ligase